MNRAAKMIVLMGGQQAYWQKVKALFGSSLLRYYPLNDAAGAVSARELVTGENGTPTNVIFGAAGIGDGSTAASFNGASSKIILPNAATIPGTEFTIFAWAAVSAAADWASASYNRIYYFGNAAGKQSSMYINGVTANQLDAAFYAASPARIAIMPDAETTTWVHVALTVSQTSNRVRGYFNGTQVEVGAFTVPLAFEFAGIGVRSDQSSGWWKGRIAHLGILNREATEAEIYQVSRKPRIVSIIGDSITAKDFPVKVTEIDYAWYWMNKSTTLTKAISHAVGGHSIIANSDADIATAANDNADIVFMQLGTNDDNAGNMTTLQTKVESNIVALKTSTPRARLVYMNVLPRWTDVGGLTPVDKSHIRTAIAAACTAQGITCLDTFTTPWITAAQTLDGVHPTSAGHLSIANHLIAAGL